MVDLLFILGWVIAYAAIGRGFWLMVEEGDGKPDPVYCALWLPLVLLALVYWTWDLLVEDD